MLVMRAIQMVAIKYIKMKFILFILFLFSVPFSVFGQIIKPMNEGKVSFISSKNVYVKFTSTEGINTGDTLYIYQADIWKPALIVKQKSSTSCVTENITDIKFTSGQSIVTFIKEKEENKKEIEDKQAADIVLPASTPDIIDTDSLKSISRKQLLNGRFTLSTNASLNPDTKSSFQRIRAAFSLNIQNINQSPFSAQTYITYRHRYGIDQSNIGFYDDFKIFTLALQFAPSDKFQMSFGRKINNNIANLGAIDGLQSEYHFNSYTLGAFLGTRPDFTDYTFNAKLPQFGVYFVRNDQSKNGSAQTSIAFTEQQNDFKTDRRFIYFQHNNSLLKNLNLFLSSEFDVFKKVKEDISNNIRLTSVYASIRYRLRKNLSFNVSYDNRRNIIFYESYQTFIDQLLAQETRQGFRFQANYNPFKNITVNASAFYRYQGSNPIPTKNYVANINFNQLPGIKASVSASFNLLESYYYKGSIIGGRISNNYLKGKLAAELNYRHVNYTFFNSESSLLQHIAGMNLSLNIFKKTSLMVSYEGTFEPTNTYHRYFITFVQRFKN